MAGKKGEHFELALQKTKLDELQKIIFQKRFLDVLHAFEFRCRFLTVFFHTLRILVTVGSLIVPALLSIQYSDTSSSKTITDPESFAYEIYWATWVISLLVTTSNGIVSVFKIDKKYYFLHTTMEQLRSEGWQYLELSGRYSGFYTPSILPTHTNQFIYFCHAVEKIKMHQVEEEYFKLTDPSSHTTQTTTKTETKSESNTNPLVHPTPHQSLEQIAKNLPSELDRELKSMESIDGGVPQERNAETKNSAKVPTLPVSADVSASSDAEKGVLRTSFNAQVPEVVSP